MGGALFLGRSGGQQPYGKIHTHDTLHMHTFLLLQKIGGDTVDLSLLDDDETLISLLDDDEILKNT